MLRTRGTRKHQAPKPYHDGDGAAAAGGGDDDDARGRSKAFVPRSAVVSLMLLFIGMLCFFYVRVSASSPSSSSSSSSSLSSSSSSVVVADQLRGGKGGGGGVEMGVVGSLSSSSGVGGGKNDNINNNNDIINNDDDRQNIYSPSTNRVLHIIFSTDCSTFQHWQSYLFFHAAYKISQPGYITRIASGCTPEQETTERQWHETTIQNTMSQRYRIHFTPHFSGVKDETTGKVKGDYKFFNKPFGLKHFLEYGEFTGLRDGAVGSDEGGGQQQRSSDSMMMKEPDAIIILCDPDFLLLRPLTDDFSNERETIISPRRKKLFQSKPNKYPQLHHDLPSRYIVQHGRPFGQTYGLGAQWRKFGLDDITGVEHSPAKDVDQSDGGLLYPAGPPYIGTAEDMYKIALKWSEFAPRVHKEYPHLLAEMYAYCIAAAHLELPHTLIDSMMISSSGVGGEGWQFIKEIPAAEVCPFAMDYDHSKHPLPSVIHFCQRYQVDKYFYSKRKVPHDIFTCDFPLLVEPPSDIGSGKYLSFIPPGRPESERSDMSPEKEKMEGFVVCALTKAVNEASLFFKERHCEGGGNRDGRYNMWSGKQS